MMLRSLRRSIPSFSLYGEQTAKGAEADPLHIEDIQSRSRKYLWRIGTHRHTALSQCIVLTAGPAGVVLEESQTNFSGPAAIVIPAGTIHSFRFRAETQGYVLTANLDRLLSIASAVHQAPIEALFSVPRAMDLETNPAVSARLTQQLDCLLQEFRQPDLTVQPVGAPIVSWLGCCVLWTLAQAASSLASAQMHSGADLDRLRRLRWLIEQHYAQHWPVERYARQLGLSETSLNRLCRRLSGCTGFDLQQQRLALEARRRLMHGPASVSGIAGELGFKDSAYFSRFFRRHSGVSPNEFRRRLRGG
jgi:AraC family transcriptional regulator, transcriptional activator of pobA